MKVLTKPHFFKHFKNVNNNNNINSNRINNTNRKLVVLNKYYSSNNNNCCNNNNNLNYNKMNNFSSLLFYNENNNKVLMVKNNINKLYKAIPHTFFGFPSLTSPKTNNDDNHNNQLSNNNNYSQYINQLPLDKIEKSFNNRNSFKRESIYYLGSLVTPYYLEQVKRNYFDYYLVIVKDSNCINKTRLENILTESISSSDPASSGGTKEKTLDISMEWKDPNELLKDFKSHRKMITPETQYILRLLQLFEKDKLSKLLSTTTAEQLSTMAKSEEPNSLGIHIPLEYAPEIESIPVRSSTLVPFNSTNLIVSHNKGYILLVDPGANKDGSLHMINIIENKLKLYSSQGGEDDGGKKVSIFITHNHKDHWEGLHLLENSFPNATVYAHQKTLDNIPVKTLKKVAVNGIPLTDKESVVQFLNEPPKSIQELESIEYHTQEKLFIGNGGNLIFHVISTPGHTDDSLCLFEKNSKTLIAGDHIVGFGSSVLDFHSGDMTQYIDSTQGIIDFLVPKVAIPAHGPLNFDPILLLNNYIKHRILREEDILNAYKSGKTSLTEILDIVYGSIDPKLSIMAMGNIKLHLSKLKKENKI